MVIVVLAVVWILALTPTVVRRVAQREPTTSVAAFGDGMRALRSAYPYLAIAQTASPEGHLTVWGPSGEELDRSELAGARLAVVPGLEELVSSGLVRRPAPPASARSLDRESSRPGRDRDGHRRGEQRAVPAPRTEQQLLSARRQRARRARRLMLRRRRVLSSLLATAVASLVIGCVPGLSGLWYLTVLATIGAACFVGAIAYERERALEREAKIVYLQSIRAGGGAVPVPVPAPGALGGSARDRRARSTRRSLGTAAGAVDREDLEACVIDVARDGEWPDGEWLEATVGR